jgi:hypothetical protein
MPPSSHECKHSEARAVQVCRSLQPAASGSCTWSLSRSSSSSLSNSSGASSPPPPGPDDIRHMLCRSSCRTLAAARTRLDCLIGIRWSTAADKGPEGAVDSAGRGRTGCRQAPWRHHKHPPGGEVHVAHVIIIIQHLLEELPDLHCKTSNADRRNRNRFETVSGTASAEWPQHGAASLHRPCNAPSRRGC